MHCLPCKGKLCALCCVWIVLLASCSSPSATPSGGTLTPAPTEQDKATMVTMLFPELYLSTNGATALLDKTFGHIEVYGIPGLERRYADESVKGLDGVALSSSGTAVALRTFGNRLTVVDAGGPRTYALPGDRGRILDMAISGAGDMAAILTLVDPQAPGDQAKDNGRLELWPLPTGESPVASVRVPLFDYGFVTANESFSAFSVYSARTSGTNKSMEIFLYDPGQGALRPLSEEHAFAAQWLQAALHGDWVWVVQEDALVGWQPGKTPVRLPGTVGDQLVFSPDGDHLLAYRVARVVEDTSAEILFRLFDLGTLKEVKRVTHLVAGDSEAHFALSPGLSLLVLRVAEGTQLEIEELGW